LSRPDSSEDAGAVVKHLGVLAHSTGGAALCFLTFCEEGFRRTGRNEHPDVTLDYIAFGYSMADFFVCPDNTAHMALEAPGPDLALPGLHIAEVVADRAAAEGRTRVGVLGTRYTMDGPLYPRAFAARGIAAELPDADDRDLVHRVIFEELVNGVISDASRQEYLRVIDRLAGRGCDAVALVCTEIPLLVTPEVSALPTLDSTRLLARAAYDVAVGERAMPAWRGGPR
jgi:aspartate racemase